jgi:hypothetical protein
MKKLTVKKLIEHLQTNFKPDDKICFWYEGGAYMNCEPVLESMLGDNMFIRVKDDKDRMKNRFNMTDDELADDYKNVEDDYVLMF